MAGALEIGQLATTGSCGLSAGAAVAVGTPNKQRLELTGKGTANDVSNSLDSHFRSPKSSPDERCDEEEEEEEGSGSSIQRRDSYMAIALPI